LYFAPNDLAELRGSNLAPIAAQLLQQVAEDYQNLIPKIVAKFPSLLESNYFTLDAYKWALSTIWSRAFDLAVKGKRERALVPFADMFNHSFDAQVEHRYDDSQNAIVFSTTKPVKAQSQVFICYDPSLSNIRMLRLYGFCINGNKNDVVEVWAPLNPAVPLYDWKKKFLARLSIDPSQPFQIPVNGSIPPAFLNYLRVQRIEDEAEMEIAKKAITSQKSNNIISIPNELVVLLSLSDSFSSMLGQYPTSHEEDVKLMDGIQNGSITGPNMVNSIILRVSEKKILREAIAKLETMRQDLHDKL